MKTISSSNVREWGHDTNAQRFYPIRVSIVCGYCSQNITLHLGVGTFSAANQVWTNVSACPSCQNNIYIIAFPDANQTSSNLGTYTMFVNPSQPEARIAVDGSQNLPDDIRTMYQEALQTFNSQAPTSAVLNQCRQALEAIAYNLTPPDKRNGKQLFTLLRELPNSVSLSDPVTNVADTLRLGGNFGSHYSPNRIVAPELREQMMDLLDGMVEYLYIIPRLAENVKSVVSNSKTFKVVTEVISPSDDA